MIAYVVRRIAGLVVLLAVISVVTFGIFFLLPGDPARLSCGRGPTAECIATARHDLGLDRSIPVQYGQYVGGIVTGRWYPDASDPQRIRCAAPCLGISFIDSESVTSALSSRLPVTVSLAVGAAVGWIVFGCGAGLLAALRQGSFVDKMITGVTVAGLSVPTFLVGLVALYLFAGQLHWLPFGGYEPMVRPNAAGISHWYWLFTRPGSTLRHIGPWASHLVLPWLTLALLLSAIYTRLTRAVMIETLAEDYIRTARAKGLPRTRVVFGHGVRAALAPMLTAAGIDLGVLLGGAALVEHVYSINGVGGMLVDAVDDTDLPKIVGITLLASAFVLVATLLVDVAQLLLDPTLRHRSRS